jgi:hypothetical protein
MWKANGKTTTLLLSQNSPFQNRLKEGRNILHAIKRRRVN